MDTLGGIIFNFFVTCFIVRYKFKSVKDMSCIYGSLGVFFSISAAISLLKVFSIIYLCPPVVCTAADFSTLGYALLCFAQSGAVVIFFAWFYCLRVL